MAESTTDRSCNASAPQPYGVLAVGRRPEDKRKGTFVAVWTGSKPPAKSKPLFCVWATGRVDCTLPLLLLLRFRGRREQNRRAAMRPAALLYGNHTTSRRCRGPRACGATRTTRLGSANHWNPRAGGVPEPRHPHGDTPGRGGAEPATVTLQSCTATAPGRADEDGIIPLPMPRRARFQLPSTLPPPHSAHPVTLPMPPRCSSPRPPPKPLPVGAQPGAFSPPPRVYVQVVSQVQYIHNPATPRPIPSAAVGG
jgi:hypothetical protein